ncbi:GIY-YIG nuclease family protein [Lentilactobacillus senioris]|uniref:GIY-YIG nuclease family protein n=1 Tax=Lentilactobacillus senioris TaxID=931534 RepID=UPI00227F023E|nr:GIY-YIG nuclease family protein [Lentilactobacillus senioris]MCY9806747.1 GIY-YIG nuclease family protein [Lentilactobacillus senioris]
MVNNNYYMYVIECQDGSLYTGYSTDVIRRFKQHVNGKGAKYTRAHKPKQLLFYEQFDNQHDALHAEAEFKKKSRSQKFAYINSNTSKLPLIEGGKMVQ